MASATASGGVFVRLSDGNKVVFAPEGVTIGGHKPVQIPTDNLIGARMEVVPGRHNVATIAALVPAKPGWRAPSISDAIQRRLVTYRVEVASDLEVTRLVDLARLLAVGSVTRCRRVAVILNPHSGNRAAVPLFERRVKPLLAFAGIDADVTVTDHAGHAIEVGGGNDSSEEHGLREGSSVYSSGGKLLKGLRECRCCGKMALVIMVVVGKRT